MPPSDKGETMYRRIFNPPPQVIGNFNHNFLMGGSFHFYFNSQILEQTLIEWLIASESKSHFRVRVIFLSFHNFFLFFQITLNFSMVFMSLDYEEYGFIRIILARSKRPQLNRHCLLKIYFFSEIRHLTGYFSKSVDTAAQWCNQEPQFPPSFCFPVRWTCTMI